MLFVVAVLDDRRTLTPVLPRTGVRGVKVPLRVALLYWLTSVMQHAADDYDGRRRGFPADVEACRALRPSVFPVVRAMRSDPDPVIASAASGAALACLLDAPELAHHRAGTATWPDGHALAGLDRYSRVMAILTLQSWGGDTTSAMETDPDPLVRAAAALAPALAGSAHGTRALLDVLSAPSAHASCTRDYPHFGPIFMSRFLPTVIERASLDDLIPALDLLLAGAPPVIYQVDWCTLLRARAFPSAGPLSAAQQALRDVVAERCFGPGSPPVPFNGDARKALIDLVPCDASGVYRATLTGGVRGAATAVAAAQREQSEDQDSEHRVPDQHETESVDPDVVRPGEAFGRPVQQHPDHAAAERDRGKPDQGIRSCQQPR
ncbi:hypothetical protein [Actinoplanes regularis]|uniref:hypothetical protein n=1 Tax=Actinoplanes regularis TaxID=52697 RepID=UPI002554E440|nr:hypothetical protein [Actinoplanes regularis]